MSIVEIETTFSGLRTFSIQYNTLGQKDYADATKYIYRATDVETQQFRRTTPKIKWNLRNSIVVVVVTLICLLDNRRMQFQRERV